MYGTKMRYSFQESERIIDLKFQSVCKCYKSETRCLFSKKTDVSPPLPTIYDLDLEPRSLNHIQVLCNPHITMVWSIFVTSYQIWICHKGYKQRQVAGIYIAMGLLKSWTYSHTVVCYFQILSTEVAKSQHYLWHTHRWTNRHKLRQKQYAWIQHVWDTTNIDTQSQQHFTFLLVP